MSENDTPIIVWFRQDLRLRDNTALIAAHETGRPIIPIYILDDFNSGEWTMGGASRWWLHQSLSALNQSLNEVMIFETGDPQTILGELIAETGATAIYWNRCYEPWRIARDIKIKEHFSGAKSFNGSHLFEPHTVLKEDGTPYKVFTPFYKKGCLERAPAPRKPEAARISLNLLRHSRCTLENLKLMPALHWYRQMAIEWQPGEQGALNRLKIFIENGLNGYKEGRNFPHRNHVSRLSPHLHFGELSPNDAWQATNLAMTAQSCETDGEQFLSELGWREFSNSLLYRLPDLPRKNLQSKFDTFPWDTNDRALEAWQTGKTGYPIVDAGMRELLQTGYMHNRVRMIVGSFLVKNLLLHWHHGEEWFWDTLVDADLANNSASWQWIAGCGADAAPYFRIFNPVKQGVKFDGTGEYVRRFVPELAQLPDQFLHNPWEAPDNILAYAGVKPGVNYPKPIVDLIASRERALSAFKHLSGI
jgi:deoxyribodipyrimidine photo-lyase